MSEALVTRAAEDARALCDGLRALGLTPRCVPLIERIYRFDDVARTAAVGHDGWVLTSPAAVRSLSKTTVRPSWIAVVGPATAAAARRAGLRVDHQPDTALGQALVEGLGSLSGQRVLYPHADLAPPDVARALGAAGAQLDAVVAYNNVEPAGVRAALRRHWPVDVVCLLSGSAARRLAAHRPPPWPAQVKVVVIGPSAAQVAARCGLSVHAVAEPHTLDGLLAAVAWVVRDDP